MSDGNSSVPSASPASAAPANASSAEASNQAPAANPASDAAKTDQQIKELKKKLKIQVDGDESEEEFDWNDDKKLKEMAQLAKVAKKRMAEKAETDKNVQEFLTALREDPRSVLSDPRIGIDIKKFAAKIIEEEIENSAKSPEQLRAEELQKELEKLKKEKESESKKREEETFAKMEQDAFDKYDRELNQVLEANKIPKNPYYIKKMANYMTLAVQNGIDVSPAEIMPLIQQEITSEFQQLIGVLPLDAVEDFVGKDVIKQIRKKYIDKARNKGRPTSMADIKGVDVSSRHQEPAKVTTEKVYSKDFFKNPLAYIQKK